VKEWTHLDDQGRARMVNVGDKPVTHRMAKAEGFISMPADLIGELANLPKGDAIQVARIAGIMAAKRVGDLIPLCHPIPIDSVQVALIPLPAESRVRVTAEVTCQGRTGVEMEALTAVSTALLTLYDMGKSLARDMVIGPVRLLEKRGGQRGDWLAPEDDGCSDASPDK